MKPLIPALLMLAVAAPASARLPQAAQDLRRLEAEYRDETVRARRLRADAQAAQRETAELERRLTALEREAAQEDIQIRSQRLRLDELSQREAQLVTRLARERNAQARLLSALQLMSRKPPPPLLIPAERATDTVRAAILIRAMAPEVEARAEALMTEQAELGRIRRLAVMSAERLITRESAQEDRLAGVDQLRARRTALAAVLKAEAEQAERSARALEARVRELGGDARAPEAAPRETASLPAGRARLTAPVAGAPSATWGRGEGARSDGWRWRADGALVRAPAAGRVAYAGSLSGWGEVVILDLGPGWRAVVAGLDRLDVSAGDAVADGQALGRSAADGEIYFELRRDERPIDPAPWLR